MQRVKKYLLYGVVISLLALSSLVLYRHQQGDKLLSVQTGSMIPAFKPGDAVLTKKIELSKLRMGDVVSYHSPADPRVIVSHRLVSINYQTGKLITKGDALSVQDIPFPSSLVIGKVYKVVPKAGAGLDWLHTTPGLIIAVYIPATLVLLYEIKHLSKTYERPRYRLYGYK